MAMSFDEYTFAGLPQLDFSEFRQRLQLLNVSDAHLVRDRFVAGFIDPSSECYRERLEAKRQFPDGLYATGYLWECIQRFERIRVAEIVGQLRLITQPLYAIWDLHSAHMVRIGDYWKFPRDSAVAGAGKDLILGLRYLPEDLYIFDGTLDWALILTHEHDDHGRTCCRALPLSGQP